ncbi:MAG: hypothetical protein ACFCUX_10235 [Candidatus Methylacidiphilales bacterium]
MRSTESLPVRRLPDLLRLRFDPQSRSRATFTLGKHPLFSRVDVSDRLVRKKFILLMRVASVIQSFHVTLSSSSCQDRPSDKGRH